MRSWQAHCLQSSNYMYACSCVCIYIYICMYVCMHVYLHIYIYICTYMLGAAKLTKTDQTLNPK